MWTNVQFLFIELNIFYLYNMYIYSNEILIYKVNFFLNNRLFRRKKTASRTIPNMHPDFQSPLFYVDAF